MTYFAFFALFICFPSLARSHQNFNKPKRYLRKAHYPKVHYPRLGKVTHKSSKNIDKKRDAMIVDQHARGSDNGIVSFSRFTPDDDCTELIVKLIDATDKRIVVMVYMLTCPKIIRALRNAAMRGVKVSVMLDKQCANLVYINELKKEVEVQKCMPTGIFHHKILLLSNKNGSRLLVIGSFNYSTAAQAKNYENIFGIFSKEAYKAHKLNWKEKRGLRTTTIRY